MLAAEVGEESPQLVEAEALASGCPNRRAPRCLRGTAPALALVLDARVGDPGCSSDPGRFRSRLLPNYPAKSGCGQTLRGRRPNVLSNLDPSFLDSGLGCRLFEPMAPRHEYPYWDPVFPRERHEEHTFHTRVPLFLVAHFPQTGASSSVGQYLLAEARTAG